MGQVRWVSWTMAIAAALVIPGVQAARADVASDKPAAILIYPKIIVDASRDTVIRIANTNTSAPINLKCFYIDATPHCQGGPNHGQYCPDSSACPLGACVPGWLETDFHVNLTVGQPFEWRASNAAMTVFPASGYVPPVPVGVCLRNPGIFCATDFQCNPFPGGQCSATLAGSNIGTGIPPVPEVPFFGELKCIAIDASGVPVPRNDLKGEALIEQLTPLQDVASYNAIGIQSTGVEANDNVLVLGGAGAEYNGCPGVLILNHFFDGADSPVVAGTQITTDLTLVPCSENLLYQISGAAVAQYLVFNEFEQRFSTSNTVDCFKETQICKIGSVDCNRSIFNVSVAGTLTGQTRISPIGISSVGGRPRVPSGLLGVAIERHGLVDSAGIGFGGYTAAFNLHMQGIRAASDFITLP